MTNLTTRGLQDGAEAAAKASVLAALARIVGEGSAVIVTLESGAVELRLPTGEAFRLGGRTVTRIA